MMSFFRATGLALCVIVLGACEPATPKQEVFLDGQYSITRPASWGLRSDLNDAADLQMGNLRKEAYAVVLSEAKADFDDDIGLEDFSETVREGVLESVSSGDSSTGEELSINGQRAIRYELTGSIDKIKIRYWLVAIDSPDHFHQLLMWSLPSQFAKNQADFELVMNSLKAQ